MSRGFIYNHTTKREKISLNGLGMKKGKYVGVSMILKTRTEVAQYYTVFNYIPPRLHKDVKFQGRKIVAGPGAKPAPTFILQGYSKEKFGKETPPYVLIMDNLETLLATIVDNYRGNSTGAIL